MISSMPAVTAATVLVLAAGPALAQGSLSEQTQESAMRQIEAEHKAAAGRCAMLRGNDVDVCRAEADGRRKVAEAQLRMQRSNSSENLRALARAQANAQYGVENERCDALQGEASRACQRQAQMNRAKAEAAIQADRDRSASTGSGRQP